MRTTSLKNWKVILIWIKSAICGKFTYMERISVFVVQTSFSFRVDWLKCLDDSGALKKALNFDWWIGLTSCFDETFGLHHFALIHHVWHLFRKPFDRVQLWLAMVERRWELNNALSSFYHWWKLYSHHLILQFLYDHHSWRVCQHDLLNYEFENMYLIL